VMVTTSRLIPDVKVGSMEGDAVLLETKGRRVLYHEGDVFEGLSWIAFADNSECASAYAGLQNLTELP